MNSFWKKVVLGFMMVFTLFGIVSYAHGTSISDISRTINTVDTTPIPRSTAGVIFQNVTTSCWRDGTCSFCDVLVIFVNVANLILRLFAIVGVIFLVYGTGFMMLSQGNEERLKRGKMIMRASIVGSVIVLLAWQIMALLVLVIGNVSVFEGRRQQSQRTTVFNPITNWFSIAQRCQEAVTDTSGSGFLPIGSNEVEFDSDAPEGSRLIQSGATGQSAFLLPDGTAVDSEGNPVAISFDDAWQFADGNADVPLDINERRRLFDTSPQP